MKVVSLAVSPFSRRVIMHEYGGEPVRLSSHSMLSKHLRYRGRVRNRQELRQHTLTSTISIELNNELAEHVNGKHADSIGMYLHNLHKRQLFAEVLHKITVDPELEAISCLRNYLDLREVEEDEFALDTAARLFRRYKTEKEKDIRLVFTRHSVRSVLAESKSVSLTIEQANKVADRVDSMIDMGAVDSELKMKMAIRSYILYEFTTSTYNELSKFTDRHQGDIVRSCKRAKAYLKTNPKLHRLIAYCIQTKQVKPVPSAS